MKSKGSLSLCLAIIVAAASAQSERALTFKSESLTFEAALTTPATEPADRWGVLLVGGGLAHDLDWRIPAELALEPAMRGDAALLAGALSERGFTVLRWSTLALEDPLRTEYPNRATPRTHAELTAQAREAIRLLRTEGSIEGARVLLVAHSLGSLRALELAMEDESVSGVALLCGARLVRIGPSKEAEEAMRKHSAEIVQRADRDRDGALNGQELAASAPSLDFSRIDRDRNGRLQPWELFVELARQQAKPTATQATSPPWGEDLAASTTVPILCIAGGEDPLQAPQSVLLAERLDSGRVELRCLPGLGHTLGKESGGKVEPIDEAAVNVLSAWLEERRETRR